ncbi:hypothetical protein ACIRRI_34145 [Streptomyces mirabilis]|uniref:hypothetical protein n=1 Tax=Streptomyces mirabilis TaxID=68239 RepID=UPI00381FAE6C
MNTTPNISSSAPDVYAEAPSITREISWVARTSTDRPLGQEADREFWLRKAALLDRIALAEAATYAPPVSAEAASLAGNAARRLAEYDAAHSGLSPRGAELVTDTDHREYVREQYREWSLTQLI